MPACQAVSQSGTSPRTRGKRAHRTARNHTDRNIPAYAGKTGRFSAIFSGPAEHPRARGENASPTSQGPILMGTSPRTRGKRRFVAGLLLGLREHPRARGENRHRHPHRWVPRGTSPRTRGKPRKRGVSPRGCRNIPAHAGKTFGVAQGFVCRPEHPRARGENIWGGSRICLSAGTSPRTRGKRSFAPSAEKFNRNIPAHAGKTIFRGSPDSTKAEHPRARGENTAPQSNRSRHQGTSPRTRGKRYPEVWWGE